jgi:phosphate transport system substrate-binding protein
MNLKTLRALTAGAAFLLSANVYTLAAAELKVSGAAAVAGNIVMPNKAAIEKESLTLNVTANGDGNGLMDLYAGKVDVAMVAAPIKVTEAALNKAKPDSVSIAGFEVAPVGAIGISFIVNAANPVKSLTEAQLKDIFTGKITSWKDVGGADKPILVVAEAAGFGTRSNIVASLLGGTEITDKARIMQALAQVGQVVGQAPDAIGYGNAATIKGAGAVAAIPGVEVKQSLGLATKGAPNADVKKLIEATAKYGAAVK